MSAVRTAIVLAAIAGAALFGCGSRESDSPREAGRSPAESMDRVAEAYVKLALALGQHDGDYVDAYYGPAAWRETAEAEKIALPAIERRAADLLDRLGDEPEGGPDDEATLRRSYLSGQLSSLLARVRLLSGARMTFDEESAALYDAVAPRGDEARFRQILEELGRLLPGEGPLAERYAAFRDEFIIPRDRLDAVFRAAIEACRARTAERIDLPPDESFEVEYVTGKSWGAYNWYQGGYHSLIQVNTDLPIHIDRAIDLACHEGYPGHHVYNVLLEQHMLRERGWIEFSVYPLFSPQSLIAEGTANYGIEVAFPGDERIAFERAELFPLAGLDPAGAEAYYRIQKRIEELEQAGVEVSRRYLDGELDAESAAARLTSYLMMPSARARQRLRFLDQYRSYIINYSLGKILVRDYIESKAGPSRRWEEFERLLASPRLPSTLR